MRFHLPRLATVSILVLGILGSATVHAAPLQISQVAPARNSVAAPGAAITLDFDKPVNPASVTTSTFRVFGRASGSKSGVYTFSNANQRVSFQPSEPFSAGETVRINLSHSIAAADLTNLRGAGYFFQFQVATVPSGVFQQIDVFTNRIDDVQTRIYGAAAADWNNDGSLDLATINEVSSDVRVCLSRDDGSGLYQPFLAPQTIGVESSPNDPADFDGDGNTDLCVAASSSNSVWILRGAGDGTFSSIVEYPVGGEPHGIAAIDGDGDGDADVVNATVGNDRLVKLINNGSGAFAAAVPFEGGVAGEYGLAAADMNNDGIADLVVGGNHGQEVRVQLGNGDGTFTAAGPSQASGGRTWVVVIDDVNGDGNLDASVANSFDNNGAILLGNGSGGLGAPAILPVGAHVPSIDLGDLDGDGDPDLVLSSFGGGFWRRYRNNGAGVFTLVQEITAPSNPSCAILYDSDGDGDLDMALTDEIADQILLMRNVGTTGVDDPDLPASLALLPNRPNPFATGTRIRFVLPAAAVVRFDVYDVGGRKVAGIEPVRREAGSQEVLFDGRDRSGESLAAGVYWYRVGAGRLERFGKMVVAR